MKPLTLLCAVLLFAVGCTQHQEERIPIMEGVSGKKSVSIAELQEVASMGLGACGRCQRKWGEGNYGHSTMYDEHRGCFPLCENCWRELATPDARLPYYRQLIDLQARQEEIFDTERGEAERHWTLLERAVMEGK